MLRCRKMLTILICLSILAPALSSYAEEKVEDLIDIIESEGKIIAIIEGKKSIYFDLRPKEKVIWNDSNGFLGSLLTNRHFLVISTTSNSWQALPLKINESDNGVATLSPYIALLVTGDRAIGFDAASNRFIETQLPIHDEILAAEVEKYVAVVITSNRAFGLAAKNSTFTEVRLRIKETIESIKITASKATVRTSDRLLTFEVSGSTWHEHRL